MTRVIVGLKWARRAPGRPPEIPKGRPRGRKAAGIRYEKDLQHALPMTVCGQWWEFEDVNGHGWCQTDLIGAFGPEGPLVVLEAKLTWTMEAWAQLEGLYIPVVSKAEGRDCLGIQVCKNLKPGVRNIWTDLGAALGAEGPRPVWHWMGWTVPEPGLGAPWPDRGKPLACRPDLRLP